MIATLKKIVLQEDKPVQFIFESTDPELDSMTMGRAKLLQEKPVDLMFSLRLSDNTCPQLDLPHIDTRTGEYITADYSKEDQMMATPIGRAVYAMLYRNDGSEDRWNGLRFSGADDDMLRAAVNYEIGEDGASGELLDCTIRWVASAQISEFSPEPGLVPRLTLIHDSGSSEEYSDIVGDELVVIAREVLEIGYPDPSEQIAEDDSEQAENYPKLHTTLKVGAKLRVLESGDCLGNAIVDVREISPDGAMLRPDEDCAKSQYRSNKWIDEHCTYRLESIPGEAGFDLDTSNVVEPAADGPIDIPRLSQIIRRRDFIICHESKRMANYDHLEVEVLAVVPAEEHIVTSYGHTTFKSLDERYRMVLCPDTVNVGDEFRFPNQTIPENPYTVAMVTDTGVLFSYAQEIIDWENLNAHWFLAARVPAPERVPTAEPAEETEAA